MIRAGHRPGIAVIAASVALLVCAFIAAVYALRVSGHLMPAAQPLTWLWAPIAFLLIGQTALYLGSRPRRATPGQRARLDRLKAAVLVPVYDEDPGYLRSGLDSLLAQTRRPDEVHVVDDGSGVDYTELRRWWLAAARAHRITTTWTRTPNRGKRHAQVTAAAHCPEADILVTVDSDATLAPDALGELLVPFADRRVQAVAGLALATNNRAGLLSRITDLWYVTMQLVDRSALSVLGSVLVSSGSLAAYRAPVLHENSDAYLGETFLGRPVTFSDDSLLTLYALTRGRVVQQTSAVVFSAMPERVGHHLRQYLRWMRGSTIRSLWRARYLPLTHPAYAAQLARWLQQAAYTVVLAWLAAAHVQENRPPSPLLLAVPLLLAASQTLRYLTVRRSDQCLASQFATWALTPLALAWSWIVLRPARWYATATCARTGWGTRTSGPEVVL
ncbi:glycosyltransferase family 2 protein [Streptomyces sp. NPDC004609]|uniref:glycosyltransferase family 2 protein n=1 Tax=Streptomyces sp. NPDC004609 TaxID=3364704 RepID=UPI0036AEC77D